MAMQNKYTIYEINIESRSPMIQNKLDRSLNQEFSKVRKEDKEKWQDENWVRKLNTEKIDGQDVIVQPKDAVHQMLISACKKYHVSPPKSIGRTWTDYFKACVLVNEPAIIEGDEPIAFAKMVNGNPSSAKKSSKVYCVRPLINTWKTKIVFWDVDNSLNEEIVSDIVTTAGKYIGLSDWRPMHGRFAVTSIKSKTIKE